MDPDIIFLMETKNSPEFIASKLDHLNFASTFHVPPHSVGGGGLSLFWNPTVDFSVLMSSNNFVEAEIIYKKKKFFATFTYGAPDVQQRKDILQELTDLGLSRVQPWYLTGDFNEIIDNSEKEGGITRTEGSFGNFRTFLSQCDLFDLRHSGNFLSWRRVRHTHTVLCRLDRALSNSTWAELFPSGRCCYLDFQGSDHRPLISFLEPETRKKSGLFRYDRRMCKNEEVKKLFAETWLSNRSSVESKISACRHAISKWNKRFHENSQKKIKMEKIRLEEAMSSTTTDDDLIRNINQSLKQAYKEEEEYWRQRSRTLWLALGDQNSGFFHATTRVRRGLNKFSVIENTLGEAVHEEAEILEVITDYFSNLFSSSSSNPDATVAEALHFRVSDATNIKLTTLPTAKEVKNTLFSIHPDKAPGPDGFSAGFFKTNWKVVGPAITDEIISFFREGIWPQNINITHLRLIPKITTPK